MDNPEKKLAT